MATQTDSFTRANEATLGSPWGSITANGIRLNSNQCDASAVGICASAYLAAVTDFTDDQSSEAAIVSPTSFDNAGVMVRASTTGGGSAYIAYWNNSSGEVLIRKLVAGAYDTATLDEARTTTWSSGNKLKLSATQSGGNVILRAYKDNVQLGADITHSSATITGGQPGIICEFGDSNATKLDDWTGADLGAASSIAAIQQYHQRLRASNG